MKYNIIHQRYDLPLGLYFSIKFDTIERPNKWITISNIPALDYFIYEGVNSEEEIIHIIEWILNNLEIYTNNGVTKRLLIADKLTELQTNLINKIIARYNNE